MKRCTNGVSRTVFLIGDKAIKVPTLRYGVKLWLQGWLANINERFWWTRLPDDRLCPVTWASWGAFVIVMERARPLTIEQWAYLPWEKYQDLPCEWKQDSFGWVDGKIVAIDYDGRASGVVPQSPSLEYT